MYGLSSNVDMAVHYNGSTNAKAKCKGIFGVLKFAVKELPFVS